jgi:hypothetical protein
MGLSEYIGIKQRNSVKRAEPTYMLLESLVGNGPKQFLKIQA